MHSLQLFLWNMMFEWQTYLEAGDLPTPACSDLYYASEERAVSIDYLTKYSMNIVLLGSLVL